MQLLSVCVEYFRIIVIIIISKSRLLLAFYHYFAGATSVRIKTAHYILNNKFYKYYR